MLNILDDDLFDDDDIFRNIILPNDRTASTRNPQAPFDDVITRPSASDNRPGFDRKNLDAVEARGLPEQSNWRLRDAVKPVVHVTSSSAPAQRSVDETLARLDQAALSMTGSDGNNVIDVIEPRMQSTQMPIKVGPARVPTIFHSEFDFDDDEEDFALENFDLERGGMAESKTVVARANLLSPLPSSLGNSNRGIGTTVATNKTNACSAMRSPDVTSALHHRPDRFKHSPYAQNTTPLPYTPKLILPERRPRLDNWDSMYQNEAWLSLTSDLAKAELNKETNILKRFNLSSLIRKADRKSLPNRKVRLVCVLLDSISFTLTDANATFVDPSGKISGTIHQDLLKEYPTQMRAGSVFVLGQVSVFTPRPKRHYLKVTTNNILHMYWIQDQKKVMHTQLGKSSWDELVEEAEYCIARGVDDTPEIAKETRPRHLMNPKRQTPALTPGTSVTPNVSRLLTRTTGETVSNVRHDVASPRTDDRLSENGLTSVGTYRPGAVAAVSDRFAIGSSSPALSSIRIDDPASVSKVPVPEHQLPDPPVILNATKPLDINDLWLDDDQDDIFANIDCA